MRPLACLGLALLLTLGAARADHVVIDPFTTPLANDSSDIFVTGFGSSVRTIAPSPTGTIEITGTNLVVSSTNGTALLVYLFDNPADLTDYDALLLRGVAVTGGPEIYADLFNPVILQSILLTPHGTDYYANLSDFTDLDLSQVTAIGLRFADTGSPLTVTGTSLEVSPAAVPEPASFALLALGGAGLLLLRRKPLA